MRERSAKRLTARRAEFHRRFGKKAADVGAADAIPKRRTRYRNPTNHPCVLPPAGAQTPCNIPMSRVDWTVGMPIKAPIAASPNHFL